MAFATEWCLAEFSAVLRSLRALVLELQAVGGDLMHCSGWTVGQASRLPCCSTIRFTDLSRRSPRKSAHSFSRRRLVSKQRIPTTRFPISFDPRLPCAGAPACQITTVTEQLISEKRLRILKPDGHRPISWASSIFLAPHAIGMGGAEQHHGLTGAEGASCDAASHPHHGRRKLIWHLLTKGDRIGPPGRTFPREPPKGTLLGECSQGR
jgi:hypothetical protein